MDALAGALWRGIYSKNTDLDEELVRKMAEHLDSELNDMLALDKVSAKFDLICFCSCRFLLTLR